MSNSAANTASQSIYFIPHKIYFLLLFTIYYICPESCLESKGHCIIEKLGGVSPRRKYGGQEAAKAGQVRHRLVGISGRAFPWPDVLSGSKSAVPTVWLPLAVITEKKGGYIPTGKGEVRKGL